MGLRARILAVVAPASGGPRSRNVLEGLCRSDKQRRQFGQVFDRMLEQRELVMYSDRRHARYGLPRGRS